MKKLNLRLRKNERLIWKLDSLEKKKLKTIKVVKEERKKLLKLHLRVREVKTSYLMALYAR